MGGEGREGKGIGGARACPLHIISGYATGGGRKESEANNVCFWCRLTRVNLDEWALNEFVFVVCLSVRKRTWSAQSNLHHLRLNIQFGMNHG